MRIQRYDTVDSTNERALGAIESGQARHGDVHVARVQTAGRGRLGRRWESAADEGLYLSYVHLPAPPAVPAERLTLATGLAVLGTVHGLGLPGARLKWPNDVLLFGAKLAGILVESRGLDPRAPHAVLGIGINVGQRTFPGDLTAERAVTSLALAGLTTTTAEVEGRLLEELPRWLHRTVESPRLLFERYLEATGLRDAEIELAVGSTRHRGRLATLDADRGLELASAAGSRWFALAHVTALTRLADAAVHD